jgi:hypothetical protein
MPATGLVRAIGPRNHLSVARLLLVAPLALTFVIVGCGGSQHVPESALDLPDGVKVVWTHEQPPEGAGDVPRRQFILTGSEPERELLTQIAQHLRARGWSTHACVSPVERCFTRNRYFVAVVAAGDAPEGYPAPRGSGPQVLAVVEPTGDQ